MTDSGDDDQPAGTVLDLGSMSGIDFEAIPDEGVIVRCCVGGAPLSKISVIQRAVGRM